MPRYHPNRTTHPRYRRYHEKSNLLLSSRSHILLSDPTHTRIDCTSRTVIHSRNTSPLHPAHTLIPPPPRPTLDASRLLTQNVQPPHHPHRSSHQHPLSTIWTRLHSTLSHAHGKRHPFQRSRLVSHSHSAARYPFTTQRHLYRFFPHLFRPLRHVA